MHTVVFLVLTANAWVAEMGFIDDSAGEECESDINCPAGLLVCRLQVHGMR